MDIPRTRADKTAAVRRLIVMAPTAGALVVAVTIGLSAWRARPPSIDRASLQVGAVSRGTLVRSVQAPGKLEASEARWLSAIHPGRVEALPLRPGAVVQADTIVVETSNAEMELQALEGARALAAARAERERSVLAASTALLNERAVLVELLGEHEEASRRRESESNLLEGGYIARRDAQDTETRVRELAERIELARARVLALEEHGERERVSLDEQVRGLDSIARFKRLELGALKLRAGVDGVLQSLAVEVGQWIGAGTTLGKVARPGALKAVLRVSEVQVSDLVLGQPVSVDTRNGVVPGEVALVAPTARDGTVSVEVSLSGAIPPGVLADTRVEGTILIESIPNVLVLGRPAQAQAHAWITLFKLGGNKAVRVPVELGAGNAASFEVRRGAQEGDRFVLSDMSRWDGLDCLSVD